MFALVAIPVALLVLWMMFQHKPDWYRVAEVDEAALRRTRTETAQLIEHISERIVHRKTVHVTLEQAQVNEWLACLPETLPELRLALPRQIDSWVVSFGATELLIGGHYDDGTWRAILNAAFDVRLSPDGRSIVVTLRDIRGGSLSVPKAVLDTLLEQLGDGIASLEGIESLDDLRSGVAIPNRFIWPNGKRPIRIGKIDMSEGKIELTLEPL